MKRKTPGTRAGSTRRPRGRAPKSPPAPTPGTRSGAPAPTGSAQAPHAGAGPVQFETPSPSAVAGRKSSDPARPRGAPSQAAPGSLTPGSQAGKSAEPRLPAPGLRSVVRLICWNEELARQRVQSLAGCGFEIEASRLNPSGMIGQFKKLAPAAVLIDLDRMPSHGHAVAVVLRSSPSTRHIPIVFAGGAPGKLSRIRKELPDAVFTGWKKAAAAVRKAAAHPPLNPAKPVPLMQRYEGSPLVTKLGLKTGMKVALVGAPEGFEELVGDWPEGIQIAGRFTRGTQLAIWFVRSAREMAAVADHLGLCLQQGAGAWICYPKQSGRFKVDFKMTDLRASCLESGLVDYKICSVDADWTALKFARRKS